ncbi:MAG: bifunctional nuclease family protein [Gaiellales bacterium]
MREMSVYGVSFDLASKQPIVLLKTADAETFLPIWIGHSEAAAILLKLQGTEPPRPMTHDLACALVDALSGEIVRVAVTELRENTFHAQITLSQNGSEVEVDSRSSDAIAIALRAGATIFASDEVLEESGVEFEDGEPDFEQIHVAEGEDEVDWSAFRQFLDTVTPDEFAIDDDESASS